MVPGSCLESAGNGLTTLIREVMLAARNRGGVD